MTSKLRPHALRLAAAVIAAASLGAGAAVIPPGTPLAARQELVRNNGAEPESLDPQLIESTNAFNILIDLFEGLTALDNHAKVVPGVAETWKQVDPTTWVFRLRKDARWSDGEPVTAADFVYGWHRLVDPKNAAPLGSTMGAYVLNGVAITQGKLPVTAMGVRAIDAGTLEVKTPGPLPFLPYLLANVQFSPVPRAVVEKYGREWTKPGNLVGNGAFVLKEWLVNSKVVEEKNPRYWDAANVALTRVTWLPVEDTNADLKLYQSGEEDMIFRTPPGAYESLKAQYPKELHNSTMIALRFWALNNRDPLLRDVRVRKALSMVIDREILAAKVTADGQAPVYGLTIRGSEGVDPVRYEWADWPMDRRVAEARKLLAEAGVKPGTRLKYAYNTSDYHKKLALFTAAEWKAKLGLDTEMEAMEYKVLIHRRASAEYQVARHAWIPGYADITGLLALVECGNDANDNKSCSRAGDDLMHQAAALSDPARRRALLTQAVRAEMDDYPMIPLLQMSLPRLVKPWIGGYDDANDQDAFRSKDFYVIRH
ncbi:MAG TPA: peptide ABC transporter substrate-binding protein [Burkholderiaceae bacterium]